jgi:general transcription factor 3C polypeptide 4
MVRTCLGCARKAFLPTASSPHQRERGRELTPRLEASEVSRTDDLRTPEDSGTDDLQAIGRSWVVQELLEAVRRCPFCGNSFVTLI